MTRGLSGNAGALLILGAVLMRATVAPAAEEPNLKL